ncbi:MAG: sulfide/dihydroorotate dehydrogenase-like FAD/NAD-binding protein [Anaerolineae bacterium]|nr:sulfide/dihydroorotate dehydrogenase-like FAD/NAD-binding protein [Anaerolineae bacterium]
MYEILVKEDLAPVTKLFEVRAPVVAKKAKAGQFVIVRVDEAGERIPLTIADYDRDRGSVTLVVQEVGKTTMQMGAMEAGDHLATVTGPLGIPSEIENHGTVLCVGGGVGIAPIYPIARDLKAAGNTVLSIIGARNKDLLFWEDKMRSVSDELIVCTDDGSYGRKALVTIPLKETLESERPVGHIWAIGPAIMMKFCALTTQPFGVPTIVSLNSIMVDGTGMCGACRVEVGGQTRFVCVDGPEFDGHQVDWDQLLARQRIYPEQEKLAVEQWEHECQCGNGS